MAEMVSVHVPTALRAHVGDQAKVDVAGGTVREVLDHLVEQHPGLRGRLLDGEGELNKFVNVYVNDEDVRFLENLATALKAGDTVTLVPSIAGG
ncbi:MAG: MoaD/ThiS family protein [Acidobacteria bacterium]|nr:MoaD/ThiS family protein [Acidobacteriota bacterium]